MRCRSAASANPSHHDSPDSPLHALLLSVRLLFAMCHFSRSKLCGVLCDSGPLGSFLPPPALIHTLFPALRDGTTQTITAHFSRLPAVANSRHGEYCEELKWG